MGVVDLSWIGSFQGGQRFPSEDPLAEAWDQVRR